MEICVSGRRRGFVCAILAVFGLFSVSIAPAQASEANYEFIFDATWTAETHPDDYPPDAHFSPAIGVVHDAAVTFWEPGALASKGIEQMSEQGLTIILEEEFAGAALAGLSSATPTRGQFIFSPARTSGRFIASDRFDRFTWVSMLAPSPDWFVGVHDLELRSGGNWRALIEIPLLAYDAGTDDGTTFVAINADSQPPQPITLIDTPPLAPSPPQVPVGLLTIRLISVDDPPAPTGDPDGDGLFNVDEAAEGTDRLHADSDGDGLFDGSDTCPALPDPGQLDGDLDGRGDPCDNCPSTRNSTQADFDADGEGDGCDLDDGRPLLESVLRDMVNWQDELTADSFNLYRGDLGRLRSEGASALTQEPDGAGADRFCDLLQPFQADPYLPGAGEGVYYLVTLQSAGQESDPGFGSDGAPRGNPAPCP
ncbi:hypothetical protein ABI59_12540 [Acidobacteria bacterium Mor1]|nr:hypothetical protein ABI59_12540 [Acidobacteria bacterium Mor1]